MPYDIDDDPDTLPYASQVRRWMELHWRHGPCPVCGTNEWIAEGRMFMVQRIPVSEETGGLARPQFPVVCTECGFTLWVNARRAGLFDSPVPDDLSGLPVEPGVEPPPPGPAPGDPGPDPDPGGGGPGGAEA